MRPNSASVSFMKAPRMSHESTRELIGPGQYEVKSEFERKNSGYTMSSKPKPDQPDMTPGPSNYSPTHSDLINSPKLSFSKKYQEKAPERSPSPTEYTPLYHNQFCKTEAFSLGKAEKMPLYGSNLQPGPGAYLSSQYSNTGVELSLGKSRKIDTPKNVPGPGAYNPKK